ncbi:hypothetical protein [Enterococcus mediterraneensis]|uniref:hypothetical protein n=1 Tax=Enterococcus mediterraneensis TaxID=2364791 RepID=UPI000F054408|nr:hypothetical protein [Enterococcus mediterraneensis]
MNLLQQLIAYFDRFPPLVTAILWFAVILLALALLFALFSLLITPFMMLYNRLTDRNKSNVLDTEDYVLGELTEKIQGASLGEVMETGSGTARSVHPARLYRETDIQNDLLLPIGTKVLIIDFDSQGVALVVKNKNFME